MAKKSVLLRDINTQIQKIVHLTSVHPPFDTRIFQKECVTLASRGYEVVLIAPHETKEIVQGIRIVGVAKTHKRLSRIFLTTFAVFRQAIRENADIYHIHDPELLLYAQLMRCMGKKIVFDMHENLPKAVLNKVWIKPSIRLILSRFIARAERFLLTGIPVVFAEDSYVRDYPWVPFSTVVLNLPEIKELNDIKEDKYLVPTVGYIGVVTPERGSVVTIEALRKIRDGGIDIDYDCIGPVRGKKSSSILEDLSQTEKEYFRFHGYMKPKDGWRLIKRCHIGMAILQPIPNYIESYPTKMFEYMAMGLPVIVSDFPLYRRIIDSCSCGLCVDPEDPGEIASAIRFLLENPKEAKAMGERGRAAVLASYNWEQELCKLINLYRMMMRK